MADLNEQHVTQLLDRVRAGDQDALPALLEVAYAELRAIAGNLFRDQPSDQTLQPTALVNELCVKLLGNARPDWNDRKHFVRAAAHAMRNLLADHARARRAMKRGGGLVEVTLTGQLAVQAAPAIDLVVLDETIERLSSMDPRLGLIFELRFLAGLSVESAADLAGVSSRTIEQDTAFIRAWLKKELLR